MTGLQIITTKVGRAALINAEHNGTAPLTVTHIGLTAANFTANEDMRVLPGEFKRIDTLSGEVVGANTIHVTVRDDSTDTYTLHGIGYWLSNGVLLGIYSQPTPILQKSAQSMMLLSADTLFTTVDAKHLTFGNANFINPPATTSRLGMVELATFAETVAGKDHTRSVTPAGLTPALAQAIILHKEESDPHPAYLTDKRAAAVFAPLASPRLTGTAMAPTPTFGNNSLQLATTAFVQRAVSQAAIGQIVFEARTSARAGYLKLNGALLKRADYPALWAYAQASGALRKDADWLANQWGAFSSGDGQTTFRLPEVRGEALRCWDDGRGVDKGRAIGSWQDSQNRSHSHKASAANGGDHAHSGWTDSQGWHGHHGNTYGAGEHAHTINSSWGQGQGANGGNTVQQSSGTMVSSISGGHGHGFDTDGAGSHQHNIGIGSAGQHSHLMTITSDGGTETRMRNLALLAMMRAY